MLTFKQWLASKKHLFVFHHPDDTVGAREAIHLCEGGKTWDYGQNWTVRRDQGHTKGMQAHVHIMLHGKDVTIINKDGTQSHGTDRSKTPNWIIDKLKKQGLIESTLIVEANGTPRVLVSPDIIWRAEYRTIWQHLFSERSR